MTLPGRLPTWIKNNKEYVKAFSGAPEMKDLRALSFASGISTFCITCLDPRAVPEQFFGPDNYLGGTFRNAGGRATPDAVRSILALKTLVDVKAVAVVHHTDCGMTHLTDEEIKKEALERTPDARKEIEEMEIGCFPADQFEETIKKDVRTLREAKVLKGVELLGFKLDTFTGKVEQLDV